LRQRGEKQLRQTKQGDSLLRAIGETISEARDNVGVTQTELARRVHVSRFQMCKHESGQAEMPITRLFEICTALKVKPTEFMREAIRVMNNGE